MGCGASSATPFYKLAAVHDKKEILSRGSSYRAGKTNRFSWIAEPPPHGPFIALPSAGKAEAYSSSSSATRKGGEGQQSHYKAVGPLIFDRLPYLGPILGRGAYGEVHLCHDNKGKYYAIKVMSKAMLMKERSPSRLEAEITILRRVSHPFIVHLFDACQDATSIYMVMEYTVGGELFHRLWKARRFGEEETKFYAGELALAIDYLHTVHHVCYRDLKPENVMLSHQGHVKLTDFSFAVYVQPGECLTEASGTAMYLSPELTGRARGYSYEVDWWALGCVIFEMMAAVAPFGDQAEESKFEIFNRINLGKVTYPSHFSEAAISLLAGLLKTDKAKRFAFKDLKTSTWYHGMDWIALLDERIRPPWRPRGEAAGGKACFLNWDDDSNSNNQQQRHQYLTNLVVGQEGKSSSCARESMGTSSTIQQKDPLNSSRGQQHWNIDSLDLPWISGGEGSCGEAAATGASTTASNARGRGERGETDNLPSPHSSSRSSHHSSSSFSHQQPVKRSSGSGTGGGGGGHSRESSKESKGGGKHRRRSSRESGEELGGGEGGGHRRITSLGESAKEELSDFFASHHAKRKSSGSEGGGGGGGGGHRTNPSKESGEKGLSDLASHHSRSSGSDGGGIHRRRSSNECEGGGGKHRRKSSKESEGELLGSSEAFASPSALSPLVSVADSKRQAKAPHPPGASLYLSAVNADSKSPPPSSRYHSARASVP